MALAAQSVSELAAVPSVRACLDWFRRERAWINEHHLKLCRIPAPTFFEQKRAEWMAERFRSLGWDARLDRAGNVIASLSGQKEPGGVAVTAHLDTVFAPRSAEEIKVAPDGRLQGPGVSDNGAGLAGLLALAAAWRAAPPMEDPALAPVLVAHVGEVAKVSSVACVIYAEALRARAGARSWSSTDRGPITSPARLWPAGASRLRSPGPAAIAGAIMERETRCTRSAAPSRCSPTRHRTRR